MQPIIFHLDMNSYFASVEQQDHPEYRGKPLGVCEHLGGIIIAASIEAKRWGIKTGTPVWEARKIYPKIILSKTHPDQYRLYIKRVMKVVSDYTAFVEQTSIDELFLDATKQCNVKVYRHSERVHPREGSLNHEVNQNLRDPSDALGMVLETVDPWEEAVAIAKEIKRRMKIEVADYLTCSIGIADNKLLAKIASDMQKPDGLVVVRPGDCNLSVPQMHSGHLPSRGEKNCSNPSPSEERGRGEVVFTKDDLYHKLKLTDIPGIGHRQEKNLNKLGIKTLKDLRDYPQSLLVRRFGINGQHLYNMGQLKGSWKPNVEKDETIKSIGHMYTLPQEYRQPKFFAPVLYKLCEMVGRRMRKKNLEGNIIHFFIHDKEYKGFGESRKLGFYICDGREIFLQAMDIYTKLKLSDSIFKLIGITVADLRPSINQLSLFGDQERARRLTSALDKINSKYGDFTVCRVPVLSAKLAFSDSIGFGRIKEE